MKLKVINKLLIVGLAVFAFSSCSKDLNLSPQNAQLPSTVYSSAIGYKSVLAKIYGTLSIGGDQGPAGSADISGGLDEGSQIALIRGFFNFEELSTDEAIEAWNDGGVLDNVHNFALTSGDKFVYGLYARPIYNITLINQYLQQATDAQLASNGITGAAATDIKNSRAEARFLRAYNYWVMLDLFGKSTFITENSPLGVNPPEITRAKLFAYVVSELKAIDGQLAPVKTIEYGRVDQGAEWALLARLYLNGSVYSPSTATPKYYDSAAIYASKVIAGGYSLHPSYPQLFLADNNQCTDEFIFAINCDGLHTQGYGNTTFLVHASCGGSSLFLYPDTLLNKNDTMSISDPAYYGVAGGWNGYRATSGLANLFPDLTGATDTRALFTTYDKVSYTTGKGVNKRFVKDTQIVVIGTSSSQISTNTGTGDFSNGLHVAKWRNVRSDGKATNDPTQTFTDNDFPVFRLAEMYLIYAEAALRGSTVADKATAVNYFNLVRERAYGHPGIAGTDSDFPVINLQNILDERGRELYWEGHRRTDLVRYGLLTTSTYTWPWKGGVLSGTSVSSNYNLLPIPQNNIIANPNLTQNPGY